jgi:uncharacterized membrane protein/mono/diheme cytochrome c family protein
MLAESGVDLVRAFGRFHPLVVHFPIALALVAVGIEWWRALSRREGLSPLTAPLLWIAAVSALASTATGWINAANEYGGDDSPALSLHRWIGTGTAFALLGLAWFGQSVAAQASASATKAAAAIGSFRWFGLVSAIAVSVTGHLGGDLVHGEGYLTDYLLPRAASSGEKSPDGATGEGIAAGDDAEEVQPTLTDADRFFVSQVRPILDAHCIECHGPRKQKGGLRMDSKAWLFNGDEEDWTVLPGKSSESLLVHRVELDRTDPDAMPPEGDGLTKDEIATLKKWIDDGAAYPNMLPGLAGAPGVPTAAASAALAATGSVGVAGGSSVGISQAVREKAAAASKALAARGVLVQPLALDSDLLDVNAMRADPPIGDGDAELLADLAPVVADLNLSKSAITDAGLAKIGAMPHLEKLRLDGSAVGDAGLSALGTLARLESINLVGAKATGASVAWLRAQPALKRVYVWQTALDSPELLKAISEGNGITAIGADLPLAQPTTPPMPEDPKPADAAPAADAKPQG